MALSAIIMPVAIGTIGLGVDASLWLKNKRDLQSAADAAVVSAAYDLMNDRYESEAKITGLNEAIANGFANGSEDSITITISETNGATYVTASISEKTNVYFSQIFMKDDMFIAAAAATAIIDESGNACFMALDENVDKAFSIQGNVEMNSSGCDIVVNSSSDEAFYAKGSADIDINNLNVVGGYDVGSSVDFEYNAINSGSVQADPYADMDVPEFNACSKNDSKEPVKSTSDTTYSAGSGGSSPNKSHIGLISKTLQIKQPTLALFVFLTYF